MTPAERDLLLEIGRAMMAKGFIGENLGLAITAVVAERNAATVAIPVSKWFTVPLTVNTSPLGSIAALAVPSIEYELGRASGSELDVIGARYRLSRGSDESDAEFRNAILAWLKARDLL